MSDNFADLFAAVLAAPDDDAPRLLMADWFEEHGQPERAKLIRVQCELAGLPRRTKRGWGGDTWVYDDEKAEPLFHQERNLLEAHELHWKECLPQAEGVTWGPFERGFVQALSVDPEHADASWVHRLPDWLGASPIQDLSLVRGIAPEQIQTVAGLPCLKQLRGIFLAGSYGDGPCPGAEGAHYLAESPFLTGLTYLGFHLADIRSEGLAAVVGSPICEGLNRLYLAYDEVGIKGANAVACSSRLHNLRELQWDELRFEQGALQRVLESSVVARLHTLCLYWNHLGLEVVEALASSSHLGCLRRLILDGNFFGDEGSRILAGASQLSGLRDLCLGHNEITDRGAESLAETMSLTNLRSLLLMHNKIGDQGAIALANSPTLSHLVELSLGCNQVGNAGAIAIAGSACLTELRELGLHSNRIGTQGALALARSRQLQNLRHLTIFNNDAIDPEAAVALESRWGETLGSCGI